MDVNRLIAYTLRIGVIASVLLSLAGLAAWIATGSVSLSTSSGSDLSAVIASAIRGNAAGLIYLGVVVLVATPVFRVAITSFYFAHDRDKKYVLISLTVFSMLMLALLLGSTG